MSRLTFILAALGLALAAAAGGTWWILSLRQDVADLTRERDAALRTIEAHEEAARVLDAHIQFQTAERQRWEQIAKDLDNMEGADAPLSDYGRAVLDRVR
ncbi:hypothetical protein [Maritimibacter sp. DP1N21-5]|uniref:hypothetical protein n=1 Tax=Maritimibacter sp. DP1N21-5 TaxID=2836867 RepID=UPI001C4457F0|nr:hypothetical protein [Maritimibacter sp. DP1N21-5]MBV7408212.1 hypothetical protein [Maritimibacter sp. DP1N21-5]